MPTQIDSKPAEISDKDVPTQEEMNQLQETVSKALNPNGENPQVESYVTSTFSYIMDVLDKVSKAEDKDAASQEVAEDLKRKWEGWVEKQEADQKDGKKE